MNSYLVITIYVTVLYPLCGKLTECNSIKPGTIYSFPNSPQAIKHLRT